MPNKFVVPLRCPRPDAKRFIRVLMGQEKVERPPLVEYIVDPVVMKPIVTELIGREWVEPLPNNRASQAAYWDNFIAFWFQIGYDFVAVGDWLGVPAQIPGGR